MSSLSLDDIANLLGDDSLKPKPKQVGLLRYNREYKSCSVCGYTCGITIEGKYFCTSHALYALNFYSVDDNIPPECTCDAGRRTMYSLHTSDCDLFDRITDNGAQDV